jgi:glutamate carboxypeptidase
MPVVVDEEKGVVRGPGVFDMKGGVVQMVFALRALSELGLKPEVTPVVFLNSDEEIGSPESHDHVERLAKSASRVLVMEPALSPEGMIKTTRRGVGQFTIRVVGKASHSGLAPEEGASGIQEMSHVIQFLHGLTDWDKGFAMNVGTVQGGTRGNVVAAECRGDLDVRVTTLADARAVEEAIRGLEAQTPGTRVEIEGAVDRAPMEATPRNVALWEAVRACGLEMGVELVQGMSGGASDGNITSLHTATVDGLGPVGDGAHAEHEYVDIDKLLERTALLALTIMVPHLNG